MSVEGLWAFGTGQIGEPDNLVNSGRMVLEADKVLGGIWAVAHIGSYEESAGGITGQVSEIFNVFGLSGDAVDQMVGFSATLYDDKRMNGWIWPLANPEIRLRLAMLKLSGLPA